MDLKSLSQLRAVEGSGEAHRPDEVVTAIFHVEPGYTPPQVTVRSRIDPEMFTGSFAARDLEALRSDKNVVSLALNQRLAKIS